MPEHWVHYEVLGKAYRSGPYKTDAEAELHRKDIAGYEGVSNVRILPYEFEPKSRLDRLLEDDS